MSEFEIHKNMGKDSTEKTEELSPKQRKKFKEAFKEELDIFNEVNNLIEEEIKTEDARPSKVSTPSKHNPLERTTAMEHSYSNNAKQIKENLNRLGIINSDPTGKAKKAAGED
jgi:hypothetical protein